MRPAKPEPIRLGGSPIIPSLDRITEPASPAPTPIQRALIDYERTVAALVAERDSLNEALAEARQQVDDLTEQRDSWERWGYNWKAKAEQYQRERDEARRPFIPVMFSGTEAVIPKSLPGYFGPALPWLRRCVMCNRQFWSRDAYRGHFLGMHMLNKLEEK